MKFTLTVKECLKSLWRAKQRTALVILGVFIGIGSFIAMVSLGDMIKEEARRRIKEIGIDIFRVYVKQGEGSSAKQEKEVKKEDIVDLKRYKNLIAYVSPQVDTYAFIKFRNKNWYVSIKGVIPEHRFVEKQQIHSGRYIVDLDKGKQVCVIGSKVMNQLKSYGARQILNGIVTLGGHKFTVVGILRPLEASLEYSMADETIFVPFETAKRILGADRISDIIIRSVKDAPYNLVESTISKSLNRKYPGRIEVFSQEILIRQLKEHMQLYTILLGVIGTISLLGGGVGIMNMMLVAVKEKRQEIGLRRAIGCKRRDILLHFLVESTIVSYLGSFFGIVVGIAASFGMARIFNLTPKFSFDAVIVGLATALAVGIFFGLYPARKASQLDPVLALRE